MASEGASRNLGSLNAALSSVGSELETGQILESVCAYAKKFTHAEKAALVPIKPGHGGGLDFDSMIVRGRRDELPDTLWRDDLAKVGRRAIRDYQIVTVGEETEIVCVPIFIRGHGLGVLAAIKGWPRHLSEDDRQTLCVLAGQASVALENSIRVAKEKRLAVAVERERIAREVHDGIVQKLFAISLEAEACGRLADKDPDAVRQRLRRLKEQTLEAQGELRRLIMDMRPGPLEALGLTKAARLHLAEIEEAGGARIRVAFDGSEPALHPVTEISLYRIMQEAVANARKHAPDAPIDVKFDFHGMDARLTIKDGGPGFDVERAQKEGEGLRNMRDRAEIVGGTLEITSAPGDGTTVIALCPVTPVGGVKQ